jgi:hypothetical protein
MVPRTWLLLTLLSCKAESLGIELPRGGPGSISQDDLRRDQWMRSRLEGEEAQAWLLRRLAEMHLEVVPSVPGSICAEKEGSAGSLWAQEGTGLEGSLRTAAMISLAKGIDFPESRCRLKFCFFASGEGPEPGEGTVLLSALSGGSLALEGGTLSSSTTADRAGEVDYEGLAKDLRRALGTICP